MTVVCNGFAFFFILLYIRWLLKYLSCLSRERVLIVALICARRGAGWILRKISLQIEWWRLEQTDQGSDGVSVQEMWRCGIERSGLVVWWW